MARTTPLFVGTFDRAVGNVSVDRATPENSFGTVLFSGVCGFSVRRVRGGRSFTSAPGPRMSTGCTPFVQRFNCISGRLEDLCVVGACTKLNIRRLTGVLGADASSVERGLGRTSSRVAGGEPATSGQRNTTLVVLSARLEGPDSDTCSGIIIPSFLVAALTRRVGMGVVDSGRDSEGRAAGVKGCGGPTAGTTNGVGNNTGIAAHVSGGGGGVVAVSTVSLTMIVLNMVFVPGLFKGNDTGAAVAACGIRTVASNGISAAVSNDNALSPVSGRAVTAAGTNAVAALGCRINTAIRRSTIVTMLASGGNDAAGFATPCSNILVRLPVSLSNRISTGDRVTVVVNASNFAVNVTISRLSVSAIGINRRISFAVSTMSNSCANTIATISCGNARDNNAATCRVATGISCVRNMCPNVDTSTRVMVRSDNRNLLMPADTVHASKSRDCVCLTPSGTRRNARCSRNSVSVSSLMGIAIRANVDSNACAVVRDSRVRRNSLVVVVALASARANSNSRNDNFNKVDKNPNNFNNKNVSFNSFSFRGFSPSRVPNNNKNFNNFKNWVGSGAWARLWVLSSK